MNFFILLSFFVLFLVQQKTNALNCYNCDPGTDGCGSTFKKTGGGVIVVPLTVNASYCLKSVYSSNTNAVSRSSLPDIPCVAGNMTDSNGISYTQYCCNTDLCNGASIKQTYFVFAMILAASRLFITE